MMSDLPASGRWRVLLAIPVYNNRSTLRSVVEEALAAGFPVLVVNDGSTDGGPEALEDLSVDRIDFPRNRGKGAAIKAAGLWAEREGYSHVITLDADGQHIPAEAARFLPKIEANPRAIIVGNRNFDENAPGSSRFGREFSNFWVRVACSRGVPDSQSGFRAYPVEALTQVRCAGRRYNFEVEILVRAVWAGLDLDWVDVSVRYAEEMRRASHFRPFLDNARISLTYTWLVTRQLLPLPHDERFNDSESKIFFSWKHPIRFWKSVHHRLWGKTGEEVKVSMRHPIRSLRLLHLERTEPHEVSKACMLGIFLGALPLIGFHTVAIFFYATRFRLNRAIAFYASNLCAPFWPPFVPALSVEAGHYMRYGRFITLADLNTQEALFQQLGREAHLRLWEWLLGSLVVGPVLAVGVGAGVYLALSVRRKRASLEEEAESV